MCCKRSFNRCDGLYIFAIVINVSLIVLQLVAEYKYNFGDIFYDKTETKIISENNWYKYYRNDCNIIDDQLDYPKCSIMDSFYNISIDDKCYVMKDETKVSCEYMNCILCSSRYENYTKFDVVIGSANRDYSWSYTDEYIFSLRSKEIVDVSRKNIREQFIAMILYCKKTSGSCFYEMDAKETVTWCLVFVLLTFLFSIIHCYDKYCDQQMKLSNKNQNNIIPSLAIPILSEESTIVNNN